MTDDGLLIAGVEYTCRVCGEEQVVYVSPTLVEDTPRIGLDGHNRLCRVYCESCWTERTHVASATLSSAGDRDRLVTDGGLSWDELEQRRWQQSTTPRDQRSRCPECHATAINHRAEHIYCKRCAEQYDSALQPHEDAYPDLRADGGTPRYKIAEHVAHAVAEVAETELDRRAADRLDAEERAALAERIQTEVEETVNGRLKTKAAETYGHDLVPDGGQSPDARQAAALERIAEELDHQSAVLAELARAQHLTAVSTNEYSDPDERAESSPSYRSLHSMIQDQKTTRENRDDSLLTDGGLRAGTPPTCPNCGYDPSEDDDEFRSGGGWTHDHSVMDGVWTETFRCPVCKEVVARDEKQPRPDGGESA